MNTGLKKNRIRYIRLLTCAAIALAASCASTPDKERPIKLEEDGGRFFKTVDGTEIFAFEYNGAALEKTVYVVSGYTGINHEADRDVIRVLSNNDGNRVVVIHPRGTGYSEGKRGDVDDYDKYLRDYAEIIGTDAAENGREGKIILYGHSISTAMCAALARRLPRVDGVILVNPPLVMKSSEGMTPGIFDYVKFAWYMIFAPHEPVVNMAGDPERIVNPEERQEAEMRARDPLLVSHISMYVMMESRKLLDAMVENAAGSAAPLLLIYGTADSIVEKEGCDRIFDAWKGRKEYRLVPNGPHGKQTILRAKSMIEEWLGALSGTRT